MSENPADESEYFADTLALWWDLGRKANPTALEDAQTRVAEFMDAASYLVAVRGLDGWVGPDQLYRRGDRLYLRKREARWFEERRPRTAVAASGYSNPWWQFLQDVPPLIPVAAGSAGSVIALATAFMAALKKGLLLPAEIASSRSKLKLEAAQNEETLRTLEEARLVDPPHTRQRELEPDGRHGVIDTIAGPRGADERPVKRSTRPSVPVDVPEHTALLALAADDLFEKTLELKLAIERSGGEFEAELIDAMEAAKRLPVAARLQRQISDFVRGEIDEDQFEDDLRTHASEVRDKRGAASPHQRPELPSDAERGQIES